ncbi:MAG: hypothetical protein WBX25_26870 [Rhodomicrobium sp.]
MRRLIDGRLPASNQDHRKAARDTAILRLAFGLGLRRNEVASLDIVHVDLAGDKLHVLGKGSRERIALSAVRRYDDNRADQAGQVAAVVDGLAG